MKVYKYLRYSTGKQDEQQQENTIDKYLSMKGLVADEIVIDEAVSGGKSYKERSLGDLVTELQKGDVIVISEISRLTRSGIAELYELISEYFEPNNLRLIICNVGLDIDCSHINPMDEMMLANLAIFAKIEKQLISDRTKSALEVRKRKGKEIGGTKNLWGKNKNKASNEIKTLRSSYCSKAGLKSAEKRRNKAKKNNNNKRFFDVVKLLREELNYSWDQVVVSLEEKDIKTATGLDFNKARCRAMFNKCKKIYND